MKIQRHHRGKPRRHCDKPSRLPGFTLIEVLVALFLIVISVVALISLLSAGMKMDMTSNHNSEATVIAKGYMEQMIDYSDFGGVDTVFNDATGVRHQVVYNGDSTSYTVNYNVDTTPSPPFGANYKLYVVTVYWQNAKDTSNNRSASLTLISAKWN